MCPVRKAITGKANQVQKTQIHVFLKTHKTRGPGCILLLFFFAFFDAKKRGFGSKLSRYALAGRPPFLRSLLYE